MAFFFIDLHNQIDWNKQPRLRDKELASIALGGKPSSMVADKLIEVSLLDGGEHWVLVHIEVQAQRDASMGRRVLDYNYGIFKHYGRPVASLIVLADDAPAWHPRAFHTDVLGTVMGISFPTAKLLDYAGRSSELLASHNPFALVTLAHLRTQETRHDAAQLYAAKWQLTKLLFQHDWDKERILVLFNVIDWMMALPRALQQRYKRNLLKLEKELKMNWIGPTQQLFIEEGLQIGLKQGLEKGLEKGLEQGLERGRKEGAVALLERQLTRRFGPLPKTVQRKLAKASMVELAAWSDALPEAQSLKQVFA